MHSDDSARISLASFVRSLGRNPPLSEKLQIAQKRGRLLTRIEAFHNRAARYWVPDSFDISCDLPKHKDPDGWEDSFSDPGSEEELEPEEVFMPEPTRMDLAQCPEKSIVFLPSVFDLHHSSHFLEQERNLRLGQANDALQGLRLALSRKAFLFREGLRNATSKVKKNRSWDQIHAIDNTARHNARVYNLARNRLKSLHTPNLIMDKYQHLDKDDLKITAVTIDPAQRGQRNTTLPWFWTLDVKGDIGGSNGMEECKFF